MATCPVCSNPVADDFGLLECGSCGAQLIIHVDGRVEYSGSPETPPPDSEAQPVEPIQDEVEPPEFDALPPELGGEVVADMFDGTEPPAAEDAAPMYETNKPANSPDLSDLADFANSSESGGREGPLRYNLFFAGIDTSDVREAFREALTDRKFLWDTEQILRSIRQGEVRIMNVSPGKAHMLISRLRNLPVTITWEQHAITQP
jgi:hypothetical protein